MKKIWAKVKGFFMNLWEKIRKVFKRAQKSIMSHKLSVLVVMQLKDKWDMSAYQRKRDIFFKFVFSIILFVTSTALLYLVMMLSVDKLGIFFSSKIPVSAMVVLLLVVILFEGISTLIGLTNALYFAKDNPVLITYPVKADYLFLSKIIVYYIDALKKSTGLLVPLIYAFGLIYGFPIYYFIWVLFLDLILTAFILLVCAVLSIPTYFIMRFLKRRKIFQGLFALAVLGLFIWGTVSLIHVIPANINLIRTYGEFSVGVNDFLKWFSKTFKVSAALTAMLCGVKKGASVAPFNMYSLIVPACLIAISALLVFVNMKISHPFYTKMISATSHGKDKRTKDKENKKHKQINSVCMYEFLRIVRDEKQIVSTIICVAVAPILILLVNKVYGAISLSLLGLKLTSIFNYFFVLLIVLSHNVTVSHIYSKDGPSWSVNKTMPIDPRKALLGRLLYNTISSIFIIVPAVILYTKQNPQISNAATVLIIISLMLFATFHILLSASYDYSNSKNKDKADIGSEIINKHENRSLLYALVLAAAVILFILLFNLTGYAGVRMMLSTKVYIRATIIGAMLVAFETYMLCKKIKATYQEN